MNFWPLAYTARNSIRLALPLSLLLCSAAVPAQNDYLFSLSLEELGNIPITGATRTEKSLRDVPAAVTLFTRSELNALGVSTLEELMNRAPGLQAYRSSEGNVASGSIRGRRVTANSREILVLLNGMKIDSFHSGSSIPKLPLANIARVEIIRGPGSALYGSNAYTGVINLVTVDDVNEVAFRAGEHQHLEGHWQHGFSHGNLRSATFVHLRDDQGESFGVEDTLRSGRIAVDDPYTTAHLQQQLFIGADTRIQFIGAHTHSENFYLLGNTHNGFNEYQFDFAGLMLEQDLHWHPDVSSQLIVGAKYVQLLLQGSLVALPTGNPLSLSADIDATEYWLDWRNDWYVSERSSLQFGGEYRHPDLADSKARSNYSLEEVVNGTTPLTDYDGLGYRYRPYHKAHMDVVGLYSQWQMNWTDRWQTIIGVRYDNFSQIGHNISPRLGLLFHADEYNTFKLLSGEAFRAPQASELHAINNPLIGGNPDLEAETVNTSELIWLHQRPNGYLSLNYFYNEFNDPISQTVVNGERTYRNGRDTEISDGVEAELQAELADGLKLLVTGTWLLKTPDGFFREAKDLYSLSALYDRGPLYGSISGYYRSPRHTLVNNTLQTLDSYWLVDVLAGYRWSPRWRTELQVLNLLDEHYYSPSQSNRAIDGVPNRRRELRLGLAWNY